ncbi:DEAD/DEAH box helicase [uncultured Kocuria sp.]|uniref:DEAD/DEAH box helicase n=1 Tax=uncultured Kocuria sp. TaxID=259305 RepID=UPI002594D6A3|nr:DEAD/DEAH box helicase [uncultured Kocuria sp.]MCT1367604.1 DEAD/DEAH box helicase [Rothia sp. p3-SID1597]
MSELLPTIQAEALKKALVQYTSTAVRFSEKHVENSFADFLKDRAHGIFKGPYVRTRLPFRSVNRKPVLDILPDWFSPYSHQAAAFERLATSPELPGEKDSRGFRLPEPTIVTTGTGSGKTESFLYPLLDYAVRARKQGIHGVKAIILYPMNALANDQASRLADMIDSNPQLAGITAGLYTGDNPTPSTVMTPEKLIEDRYTIRDAAPDILLTNYKMLDQLLLRREDRRIWEDSAEALRYLVLDEFHTYNGAQGTDVAMLIRRLRLLLERLAPGTNHLVPVATSATLGDQGDGGAVARFAQTVFGSEFTNDSVVVESRVSVDELGAAAQERLGGSGLVPTKDLGPADFHAIKRALIDSGDGTGEPSENPEDITAAVLNTLWTDPSAKTGTIDHARKTYRDADLLLAHSVVQRLLHETGTASTITSLVRTVLDRPGEDDSGERFLENLVAALSHARSAADRNQFPNVEVHLWIREISRVDRVTSSTVDFVWSDEHAAPDGSHLPAIYCRACGASGWGTVLTGTDEIRLDAQNIRQQHARNTGRFRALILAPQEVGGDRAERVRFLNPETHALDTAQPSEEVGDIDQLPVIMWTGLEADQKSNDDVCPSCEAHNTIRFVGSAIATLLSVALSNLFGTPSLDPGEKKSLVFTDSVQDAAHRAAFVESRSYALSLRSAIHSSLAADGTPLTADDITQRMVDAATSDADRYRLLPSTIAHNQGIRPFWEGNPSAKEKRAAKAKVLGRLSMEIDLEVGLTGSYGRTLATTGTAVASVRAEREELVNIGRSALEKLPQTLRQEEDVFDSLTDHQVEQWVRGVLERMRLDGAISHPWFRAFRRAGGTRYRVWGGRNPRDAMRAFPPAARTPEFPYVGRMPATIKTGFPDLSASTGRFARLTAQCLPVGRRDASHVLRPLFDALTRAGITDAIELDNRKASVTTYGLQRERVVVARIPEGTDDTFLVCPVCGNELTGLHEYVKSMEDAPCLTTACQGQLQLQTRGKNYYQRLYRGEMLRVISREHTSLLPTDERLEYENQFKNSADTPGAPNVLVATPTLEMGIDIGDLSMVILSSLPRTVASYLQRVGRSGRKTGNSLDLTFLSSRGSSQAVRTDPDEMINGSVRPPAAYLSAEEILHRQYLAFLMDRLAGDSGTPDPAKAAVLKSSAPGTFLGAVLDEAHQAPQERLDEFLSEFDQAKNPREGITPQAIQALRDWATPDANGTSSLSRTVHDAVQRWNREKEELGYRLQKIRKRMAEVRDGQQIAASDADSTAAQLKGQEDLLRQADIDLEGTEDPEAREKEIKKLYGQERRTRSEQAAFNFQHWVGVLERFGLLPNFTLYDDSVELDVTLTWKDDDGQYHTLPQTFHRSGFRALKELAPGNHFYAQGQDLEIDTVDLGMEGSGISTVAFCPRCGHQEVLTPGDDELLSCRQCQDSGIGDPGQSLNVVKLKKVYSSMDKNLSTIGDASDIRRSISFETRIVPDFNRSIQLKNWSVDGTGIGVNYRRDSKLTNLNIGRSQESGQDIILAGDKTRTSGFLICAECGHVDQQTGTNSPAEHQPWCSNRALENSESIKVVLARELVTESILLSIPKSIGEDTSGVSLWSFYAAVRLGLRELFGGEIDHLSMETIKDTQRNNAMAILLYDDVPGGTGYLSEMATPESLHKVFLNAWRRLSECPCVDQDEPACHKCLLPYVESKNSHMVSRSRAEQLLHTLLAPDEGQSPEDTNNWSITADSPKQSDDFESSLESRFMRVFRQAAGNIEDAQLTDTVGDGGRGFTLFQDGVKFTVAQQVQIANTRPDVLITWNDNRAFHGAAIFLDGKRFHATPSHNRLADDAAKRRTLRELGYLVFAVTDQDLNKFEGPLRDGDSCHSEIHDMADAEILERLRRSSRLSAEAHEYFTENPVAQLLRLFRGGTKDPWKIQREVSESLSTGLFSRQVARHVIPDRMLTGALALLDDARDQSAIVYGGRPNGLLRADLPLAILAMIDGDRQVVAVLDDREQALTSEDFDRGWRQWLAIANLAQPFADSTRHPTTLETWTTLSQALSDEATHVAEEDSIMSLLLAEDTMAPPSTDPDAAIVQDTPATTELSPEWQDMIDDALDAQERTILRFAAERGLPIPEQGEEFGGYMVDLAWLPLKIAWVGDEKDLDKVRALAQFTDWTVTGPDVDGVRDALNHHITESRNA